MQVQVQGDGAEAGGLPARGRPAVLAWAELQVERIKRLAIIREAKDSKAPARAGAGLALTALTQARRRTLGPRYRRPAPPSADLSPRGHPGHPH